MSVLALAAQENLHAAQVGEVTDAGRMELVWRGQPIVSIQRSFLNTNGATAIARGAHGNPRNAGAFRRTV